jgi:hypothetical protein
MNPRIRELAEQAEFSEKDLHIQDDNFQKFAELIVRECVLISRTGTDGFSAGRRMEQHFGVE